MCVTRDALAVETPRWMVGDSEFDMLEWHDHQLEQAVVPVAPYNLRNTDDPLDIEYRVKEQIKEHSDTVRLWQCQLEETTHSTHGLKQRSASVRISVSDPWGPEVELGSKLTSSLLSASDWPLLSPIITEETISLAQPPRYESHSALLPSILLMRPC